MQDDAGEPAEDVAQVLAREQRRGGGRPQPLDDPMEDGAEERGLVVEAVIERPFRNARARATASMLVAP